MLKAIIYGYMNNIYSCRRIESSLKRDINFIWLAGYEQPDFNTINRFRNRVKNEINQIFTKIIVVLCEKGFITLDVEYIDGTKIESKANKYTFVWKKSTENNRAKLINKIKVLLEQIDDVIAQEKANENNLENITPLELKNIAKELNEALDKKTTESNTKEDDKVHKQQKKQLKQLCEHADKLDEYNEKLEVLGERNSYSKTDQDATFMRMKEDAMNNGQTKPGYNLQIGTENQFILDFKLFRSPGDPLTMIPFFNSFKNRYNTLPKTAVADSGYGSEENYEFMDKSGIEAYVKYNMFHKEQRMHYEPNPFSSQALYYNCKDDYYVCPMGQHMNRIGVAKVKTSSGYICESIKYQAVRCQDCPLRCSCFKAKGNRIIEINHKLNEYRKQASQRLISEKGKKYRGKRCVEPEAVFGQIKYDMSYKRFRHFGLDKVNMDFAFFAIAFNLRKMCNKIVKSAKKGGNRPCFLRKFRKSIFLIFENQIFIENIKLLTV